MSNTLTLLEKANSPSSLTMAPDGTLKLVWTGKQAADDAVPTSQSGTTKDLPRTAIRLWNSSRTLFGHTWSSSTSRQWSEQSWEGVALSGRQKRRFLQQLLDNP